MTTPAFDASVHRSPSARGDFTIDQHWEHYTETEHATWSTLYRRMHELLPGRACAEYLAGLDALEVTAGGIPDFRRLNEILMARTGWQIVAVPGLVPDGIFFEHLANRRFPSTCFMRRPDQLDYIEEPDVFHDVFGHVPLLVNPVFADYMQAYGKGGVKAMGQHALHNLARLYWYTVEFGLIRTAEGLRIYGSGILSSPKETMYALDSAIPNRIGYDLVRIMRTNYRIDDVQESYFVIDSFEDLFRSTDPDFTPYYTTLAIMRDLPPGAVLPEDEVLSRGQVSA
ncbi:MAG: phenylalanine 4-monooxygenase [Alphaproteobacteria bacterium]|nr:phenylalanine 4-monooxygenase [Alphaproteobacteria bacterium]